jgi:hypothetical protein
MNALVLIPRYITKINHFFFFHLHNNKCNTYHFCKFITFLVTKVYIVYDSLPRHEQNKFHDNLLTKLWSYAVTTFPYVQHLSVLQVAVCWTIGLEYFTTIKMQSEGLT